MNLLERRRQMMMSKSLPYDAEIEYLESTGTQYIDTGIKGRYDTEVTLDVEFTSIDNATGAFGSFSPSTEKKSLFLYTTTSGLWQVGAGENLVTANYMTSDTNRHVWKWNGKKVYKDGSVVASFNTSYVDTLQTMVICSLKRADGTLYNNASLKIYSCKIGEVLDLIPVRVCQVGYMYDRVSGTLFGNDGTGSFVLGPDVQ